MRKYIVLILSFAFAASASAQSTFNMPSSGTVYNTGNDCWIYDDGGATNDYGTYVDSYMYLNTTSSNVFYNSIHLEYAMEAFTQTKIEIYDNNRGTLLFSNYAIAADTIDIPVSCVRSVRIYFHTDSEVPQGYGFALHLGVCDTCPDRVQWVNATVLSDNHTYIKWDTITGVTDYLVEISGSVFAVQGDSLTLPVISSTGDTIFPVNHCGYYRAYVYTACDTAISCFKRCYNPASVAWYQCSCPQPSINSFYRMDNTADGISDVNDYMVKWSEPSDTIEWTVVLIYRGTGQELYRVTSDTNYYLFENLDTCFAYSVNVFCNCHDDPSHDDPNPIICKSHSTWIDKANCAYVCPIPLPVVTGVSTNTNTITVTWSNAADTLSWVASIYIDTVLIETDTITDGTITFNNLTPATTYTITIYGYYDTITCNMLTLSAFTDENCIPYYDLYSPLTDASYGNTSANPYTYHGVVDNGEEEVSSRHTINTNVSAKDPRTGNLLSLIPAGATQSVRLGNWEGGKSEALTYTYLVDTNVNDLLLLRYAVVLYDPPGTHPADRRPSFTLVILDSTGAEIDSVCGKADFVAGENTTDWNVYQGSILWKDWTAVGFDMSAYHNKKIKIRLTTKDCADGNATHFGYAYFTLECNKKQMSSFNCGEATSSTFTAPEGFSYQWYNASDTNAIISTERELIVSTQATQFLYCIVSNLENPDCKFRIDATAGNRFPIAAFDYNYTFENCEFTVHFTNTSYVSTNALGSDTIEQSCETIQWFLHDGYTQSIDTFAHTYQLSGNYVLRIIAGLSNNSCTDTLDTLIHLVSPVLTLNISGDSSICLGTSTTLTASTSGQYLWNTGDTTQSITIAPDTTTLYSVSVSDTFGCTTTAECLVEVRASYHDVDVFDTICDNAYYAPEGTPLTEEGIYYLSLQTIQGCDSVIYLHLTVNPTFLDTIYDSVCINDSYEFYGQEYDEAGIYYANLTSVYGCDSIYVLNLAVKPIYTDTIKADVFKGKTFSLFGFSESEKGIYTHTFEGSNGCDSIVVLDLTVDNVMFPSVITANDDGVNDVFVIHNLLEQNIFPENELIIFNRYGKLMYHKKNISQESDFWKPDASTPTGTYFYRFIGIRHDKTWDITGTIEVIR
ncbi:MAG: gliding motility-associated C-terminal domain-containing protein [Bacteroidales bacterium]|jgi:gliding motility-associated-like protein|nr:gliding motility-associated C-terminal domain-containing protein [Bacteroidales bacterium]